MRFLELRVLIISGELRKADGARLASGVPARGGVTLTCSLYIVKLCCVFLNGKMVK